MGETGEFKVNFFISHKSEYKQAARGLKDILELWGGRDVNVFLSEDIAAGSDWYEWITSRLRDSNVLLLMFTEEALSWDWPLYEAGLFTRLGGDDHRKVVCLHHPDIDPPKPLKHLQTVPAKQEEMEGFLRSLFGTTEITALAEPINSKFANNKGEVEEAAEQICGYFVPHSVIKRHYCRFLDIKIREPQAISPTEIPEDAKIVSNSRTLAAFGLAGDDTTWGALEKKVRSCEDSGWLDALKQTVYDTKEGGLPATVLPTFKGWGNHAILRPEVWRSDGVSDGSLVVHVLFVEELEGPLPDMPEDVKALATNLKFAFRFRWEVLDKFAHPGLTERDVDALEATMMRIEKEAQMRGMVDPEVMIRQFSRADAERVRSMLELWYGLRNPEGTGELDIALKEKDPEKVTRLLTGLLPLNREYVELVARRFADAMAEPVAA